MAEMQVLQEQKTDHPHSYGFRPQRSAHQAVRKMQADIQQGYGGGGHGRGGIL